MTAIFSPCGDYATDGMETAMSKATASPAEQTALPLDEIK